MTFRPFRAWARSARGPGHAGVNKLYTFAERAGFLVAVALVIKAAMLIAAPVPAPPMPEADAVSSEITQYAGPSSAGGHPFLADGDSRTALAAPLEESALNIVLYGTWRGAAGAAAVISADGAPQRKVAVGEEIAVGITLEDVQDEFVIISNQGAREAVAIANREVDIKAQSALAFDASEALAPQATGAPLRDIPQSGAVAIAPTTVSAGSESLADAIAAAEPHETD